MVFDVRFRPKLVGDFFLRPRCDRLICLEFGDQSLTWSWNLLI